MTFSNDLISSSSILETLSLVIASCLLVTNSMALVVMASLPIAFGPETPRN